MKRKEVYKVIDGERDYQDKKRGGKKNDEQNSLLDWYHFMSQTMNKVYEVVLGANDDEKHNAILDELRQVVALGIACMEVHGVPERVVTLPENYV